jgi:hypothetical protein
MPIIDKEMWKRLPNATSRHMKSTANVGTTARGTADFSKLIGKEFVHIITVVPTAYLEESALKQTTDAIAAVIGPCEVKQMEPGIANVAIIKPLELSDVGVQLLGRGYWRREKVMHPRDGAPKEEYSAEVLAVHKDTIVGTDALPMQKITGG